MLTENWNNEVRNKQCKQDTKWYIKIENDEGIAKVQLHL